MLHRTIKVFIVIRIAFAGNVGICGSRDLEKTVAVVLNVSCLL